MEKPPFTAYCINLERRGDRWQHMRALAETHGFTLTRIDAVDAQDPENQEMLAALPGSGPTGALDRGALACTLSHARAWRALLDSDLDRVLVLEDDVVLDDGFLPEMSEILAKPKTGGLIKLEGSGVTEHGVLLGRNGVPVGNRVVRKCYHLIPGSAGYVISREVAETALRRVPDCDVGVDHFLFYPRPRKGALGVPFSYLDPPFVAQAKELRSDIARNRYKGRRWRRDLKRLPYEAALAPMMLMRLISGQATIRKSFFKL